MMEQLAALVAAFVYIFVIIDPLASLPVFITLTEKMKDAEVKKTARDAVLTAGVLALVFLFAGNQILSIMKIDFNSFRIAGGLVLGLLGLETVLGFHGSKGKDEDRSAVVTLIATPMLTGPGLITVLIVMTGEMGYAIPLVGTLLSLFVSWIILDRAVMIKKLLGHQTIDIFANVFGLFLVAIGISFIKGGLGA